MSRYLSFSREVDVDIDLSVDELVEEMGPEFKAELLKKICGGGGVPFGAGDGDSTCIDGIVERAYLAAKALPSLPREISDLFWHVHGRAM